VRQQNIYLPLILYLNNGRVHNCIVQISKGIREVSLSLLSLLNIIDQNLCKEDIYVSSDYFLRGVDHWHLCHLALIGEVVEVI